MDMQHFENILVFVDFDSHLLMGVCRFEWQTHLSLGATTNSRTDWTRDRRRSNRQTEFTHLLRINQPTPTFRAALEVDESGVTGFKIQQPYKYLHNLNNQPLTLWSSTRWTESGIVTSRNRPTSRSLSLIYSLFMFLSVLSFLGPMNFNNGPMHMRACTTWLWHAGKLGRFQGW